MAIFYHAIRKDTAGNVHWESTNMDAVALLNECRVEEEITTGRKILNWAEGEDPSTMTAYSMDGDFVYVLKVRRKV